MRLDDVEITVHIGEERRLWDDARNSIQGVTIFHKYAYAVTCAQIILVDNSNTVTQVDLSDGQLITLTWGRGRFLTYEMRIARTNREKENNVFTYTVFCYMNEIKWFLDGSNRAYRMTSSEAIAQIAEDCGLESEVDETSDNRVWFGNAQRHFKVARKIAKGGFVNDRSLMAVGYMPGIVKYKDLNAIDIDSPVGLMQFGLNSLVYVQINERRVPQWPVTSVKTIDRSGVFNLMDGYKVNYDDTEIENPSNRGTFDSINVRNRAGVIGHNTAIADQIQVPSQKSSMPRTDNTHLNQGRAQYQNKRGMQTLFNTGIALLTPVMTDLSIFDPIWVRLFDTTAGAQPTEKGTPNDGPYIVMARIIAISGSTYVEKIIAYREGTKND